MTDLSKYTFEIGVLLSYKNVYKINRKIYMAFKFDKWPIHLFPTILFTSLKLVFYFIE